MDHLKQYQSALEQHLDDAYALPFQSYTNTEIFNLEQQKIFYNDWVFVGHELEIPNKGDYKSLTLLGESLIITRKNDDSIIALSNHCRHKGTLLVDEGTGNTKRFSCPYHAWAYSSSGELKGVPFPGKTNIDKSKHCLPSYKLESWQGLLFVNLSGTATELKDRYKEMNKYLEAFDTKRFKHALKNNSESWKCNWKIAMENAMESYHLFAVHKETLEKTTPTKKAFYIEGSADWTLTGGNIVDAKKGLLSLFSGKKHDYLYNYVLFSLPPNFVGILTYDSFGWIQILPEAVDQIKVISGGISPHQGQTPSYIEDFTRKFFQEDLEICERVQRSMQSPLSKGGKLVELERVVVDFRQYLAKHLFSSTPAPHFTGDEEKNFPWQTTEK